MLFFNEIIVDDAKWRSSARNVEIRFRTPSQFSQFRQFRQFVVEVSLWLRCV